MLHIEKLIEMTFNSRDIVNMWPNRKQQHVSYITKASDLKKSQLRQRKTNCTQTSQFGGTRRRWRLTNSSQTLQSTRVTGESPQNS